ncbi:MAG: N-carbamoylputrescine amidase [Campylobacterota bacterium]|nr:N-carbamoylputrescine amidase [Campylobacterota bacterium]
MAAIQMRMCADRSLNRSHAKTLVRKAATQGANIILLPELFEGLYFCKDKDKKYFSWAVEKETSTLLKEFSQLAKELHVVLPISYFEKSADTYFNSLVVIDADGEILQNYRKTHIPDGPGYEEKFYFTPGDSGFQVYDTTFGRIGVGICWDQWFPETARSLALKGAELIFYPTAIGSEPEIKIDSKEHWQQVQMGHAAANTVPVIVANRFGIEKGASCELNFYGSSFITNVSGAKVSEASRESESIIYASFDLEKERAFRDYWGLLHERRPECYKDLI